jgi:hypothetical protein
LPGSVIRLQTKKFTEKLPATATLLILRPEFTTRLKKHTSITAQLPPLFQAPPPLLPPSNESGLIQDLKDFAERLIPSRYHHDDRWGDNNGFCTSGPHLLVHPSSHPSKMAKLFSNLAGSDFD